MRFLHVLIFLIFSGLQTTLAQDSDSLEIKKYYEQNTIYWPGRKTYIKNDQHLPFKNLKNEFTFSREGSLEFSEFKRDRRRGIICLIIAEVAVISAVAIDRPASSLVLLGSGFVAAGLSIKFSNRSIAHLQRSIWVHNRDVLLR